MKIKSKILIIFAALAFCLIPVKDLYAGFFGNSLITTAETDTPMRGFGQLIYVFDLRERETFIQVTYSDIVGIGLPSTAHIQIFDVSNNCNENNFFDVYTVNDTHTYNMRDIQTNDGNPSGVVLPEGAYGIVAITNVVNVGETINGADLFSNVRILDNNGYEYRTNAQALISVSDFDESNNSRFFYSFNFNQESGVTLSDVYGITLNIVPNPSTGNELVATPVQGIFSPFDIDIYNLNEVPFSCRDVIFSCVDEDNPLLGELLEIAGTASVASFEYGINNAIPHSKGGELLCPNNNIGEGFVVLRPEAIPSTQEYIDLINSVGGGASRFVGFIGLNNGNGRGSMDSFWGPNRALLMIQQQG